MSLLTGLLVWVSGFCMVFLLGFQSRNAMAGRYLTCAFTSFLIGTAQAVAVHAVAVDPVLAAVLIGSAGSAGICTAIFTNTRVLKLKVLT